MSIDFRRSFLDCTIQKYVREIANINVVSMSYQHYIFDNQSLGI